MVFAISVIALYAATFGLASLLGMDPSYRPVLGGGLLLAAVAVMWFVAAIAGRRVRARR